MVTGRAPHMARVSAQHNPHWLRFVDPSLPWLFLMAVSPPSLNVCKGHTNEVTAVAAQPTGDMFASGSVDQTIRLWGTDPDAAEPAKKTSKRRKVGGEGEGEGDADEVPVKRALGRLNGSMGSVHALCWPERGTLYRLVPFTPPFQALHFSRIFFPRHSLAGAR